MSESAKTTTRTLAVYRGYPRATEEPVFSLGAAWLHCCERAAPLGGVLATGASRSIRLGDEKVATEGSHGARHPVERRAAAASGANGAVPRRARHHVFDSCRVTRAASQTARGRARRGGPATRRCIARTRPRPRSTARAQTGAPVQRVAREPRELSGPTRLCLWGGRRRVRAGGAHGGDAAVARVEDVGEAGRGGGAGEGRREDEERLGARLAGEGRGVVRGGGGGR